MTPNKRLIANWSIDKNQVLFNVDGSATGKWAVSEQDLLILMDAAQLLQRINSSTAIQEACIEARHRVAEVGKGDPEFHDSYPVVCKKCKGAMAASEQARDG